MIDGATTKSIQQPQSATLDLGLTRPEDCGTNHGSVSGEAKQLIAGQLVSHPVVHDAASGELTTLDGLSNSAPLSGDLQDRSKMLVDESQDHPVSYLVMQQ